MPSRTKIFHPSLRYVFPLLAGLAAAGCREADKASAPTTAPAAAVPVTTQAVRLEPVDRTVDVVGTLYGDDQVTLAAKVPGRIREIAKDIGDRVDEAGLLARIDPVDFELALAQRESALREALSKLGLTELPNDTFEVDKVVTVERAKVQARNAGAKFERNRTLFEQKPPLLSEQDFADAQTAFEVAKRDAEVAVLQARTDLATARSRKADLDAARQNLDDTFVRAPRAGDPARPGRFGVSRRTVSVGSYVREGDVLYEVVADDPIKFRAAVPERFVQQIKVGQVLHVAVEGSTQRSAGTVRRINPQIDVATRTFEVEGVISNPDRLLRPGAFARGSIVVDTDPAALFVPANAIYTFAGTDKVFGETDGRAVEHVITRGEARNGWVQIKEKRPGLTRVITSDLGRLSNQTPVQVETPTTQNGR
ncbi:MAG TPA: efflux RND transporter periplasmic adaptor subunit [Tepidisphaeraceae bacterium]